MVNFQHRIILCFLAALLAFGPSLAYARAGGGRSFGSRGTQTYQQNGAQPLQRSITPPPSSAPSSSGFGQRAPFGSGFGGGYGYNSHPFLSGIAGGFLGAGLAGMLFGHGFYGGGMGGMGGGMGGVGFGGALFSLLLQIVLVGAILYFALSIFRNRGSASGVSGGGGNGVGFGGGQNFNSLPAGGGLTSLFQGGTSAPARIATQPIELGDNDLETFSRLLIAIQTAWSKGDLQAMRRYVTPEMLQYFSEALSSNSSRGIANIVEQVKLQNGKILEAWHEYELDYATARLEWQAIDYDVRLDQQQASHTALIAQTARPTVAEEVWTFVRSSGGEWLLSAIQQS